MFMMPPDPKDDGLYDGLTLAELAEKDRNKPEMTTKDLEHIDNLLEDL